MKRKSVKRKTAKTPASVPLLRRDESGNVKRLPETWLPEIEGVAVPADLPDAIEAYSGETYLTLDEIWEFEPWRFFAHYAKDDGSRYTGDNGEIDLADPASWKQPGRDGGSVELRWGYHELDILQSSIRMAMAQGFYLALLRYADDLKHVPEVAAFLEQRRENGELLAAEGRAVKAENDKERAAMVCKLYKAVRPSFPEGRKGNGPAHRTVAGRFEQRTGKSITVRAVREILKRSGAV